MGRRSRGCERSSHIPSYYRTAGFPGALVSSIEPWMARCALCTVARDSADVIAGMDVWTSRQDAVLRHLAPAYREQFISRFWWLHDRGRRRRRTRLPDRLVSSRVRPYRSDHSSDAPDTDHILGSFCRNFLRDPRRISLLFNSAR